MLKDELIYKWLCSKTPVTLLMEKTRQKLKDRKKTVKNTKNTSKDTKKPSDFLAVVYFMWSLQ